MKGHEAAAATAVTRDVVVAADVDVVAAAAVDVVVAVDAFAVESNLDNYSSSLNFYLIL